MALPLTQTHDKIGVDVTTGWTIWRKSIGLGVRKGLPSQKKFIIVDERTGKKRGFDSLADFEVFKQQAIDAGVKFKKSE